MTALHNFAVSILNPQIKIRGSKGIDDSVVYVCLGLFVKACRQFRSVQRLCQAGLGSDAHALTRNLFETWLALMFVERRRVTLKQGKKAPWPRREAFSGQPPSRPTIPGQCGL